MDSSDQIQIRILEIHILGVFLGKDPKKVFLTNDFPFEHFRLFAPFKLKIQFENKGKFRYKFHARKLSEKTEVFDRIVWNRDLIIVSDTNMSIASQTCRYKEQKSLKSSCSKLSWKSSSKTNQLTTIFEIARNVCSVGLVCPRSPSRVAIANDAID